LIREQLRHYHGAGPTMDRAVSAGRAETSMLGSNGIDAD
jgi:hypothetical protein